MGLVLPVDTQRVDIKRFNPFDITAIGRDTRDGDEHILWRSDCKRAVDPQQKQSILDLGQQQNGIVRKTIVRDAEGEAVERMELVVGMGRLIAMRELWLETDEDKRWAVAGFEAKVLPKGTTDEEILRIIADENTKRKPDQTAVEKAREAVRMQRFGMKLDVIADTLSTPGNKLSVSVLKEYLKLLELAPEVQKAVEKREVPTTTALQLLRLPREEHAAKLAEWTAPGAVMPTVAEAKRETKNAAKPKSEREEKGDVKAPMSTRLTQKILKDADKRDEEGRPQAVGDIFIAVLDTLEGDGEKWESATKPKSAKHAEEILDEIWKALRVYKGKNSNRTVSGLHGLVEGFKKKTEA